MDKNKELKSPTLCTDDCLCWSELDKEGAKDNAQCAKLCDEDHQENTLCQALENCRCDLSNGQQLICRNNGWSSEETRYGCQEKKAKKSFFRWLFGIISYPFKFLWYLLSKLVALFDWLLRTIFSAIKFVLSILFKLLSWAFWLLERILSTAFSLMFFLGSIAAFGLACFMIYRYIQGRHILEVEVRRRVVIERTIYL